MLSFAPTYSMYPEYARDSHTGWIAGPRADDFTIDLDRRDRADRASTNPTSCCSPRRTTRPARRSTPRPIEAICDVAPGMVIVDEAYAEFRRAGTPSALALLPGRPRLVVTRTMSKAFALAGGRLGYLAADPAVVDAVSIVRLPYHLSAVSQVVARTALAHARELLARVGELRAERDDTVAWLRSIGLRAADSDANFVLFGTFADRHAVWQGLLDRDVLIRETGPDGWLRVSIGTPDEMAAFRTRAAGGARSPVSRYRHGSSGRPTRPRSSSRSTSTASGAPTSAPASASTTTCSSSFGKHGLFDLRGAGRGRPAHRRPPHRRGHRDRARPGLRAGRRRQGRHPALRRRADPDGRGAGAGRGRPVRAALPGAPRARRRAADHRRRLRDAR